jgi:hypothetical protein
LNILKNRYDETTEPGSVILNPGEKLCSTESTIKLTDELGMKELDALYYDIFDYNTKKWSKRSNKMKKKYNKDLILFYRIYTGKRTKPSNIKSFQDIELLNFKTLDSCSDNNFLSDIVVSKENKLIKDYKEKIDLMQNITEENRNKFYGILKEIFVVKMVDNEQSYTINPSLTMDKILLLEDQTRSALLDLYISCEKYFIQALIIFENIYESKDYTISEYRKENLMKIPPPPTPINYKDSLTITPPFSPDIQPSEPTESIRQIPEIQPLANSQPPNTQNPDTQPTTQTVPEKSGIFDFFKNLTSSEKNEKNELKNSITTSTTDVKSTNSTTPEYVTNNPSPEPFTETTNPSTDSFIMTNNQLNPPNPSSQPFTTTPNPSTDSFTSTTDPSTQPFIPTSNPSIDSFTNTNPPPQPFTMTTNPSTDSFTSTTNPSTDSFISTNPSTDSFTSTNPSTDSFTSTNPSTDSFTSTNPSPQPFTSTNPSSQPFTSTNPSPQPFTMTTNPSTDSFTSTTNSSNTVPSGIKSNVSPSNSLSLNASSNVSPSNKPPSNISSNTPSNTPNTSNNTQSIPKSPELSQNKTNINMKKS